MQYKTRWLIAAAVLLSGCALQDTRYDYSRMAAGLGNYDESILDWNFPTTTNQGPLLPPERLRPIRPAIGVPWATANPMPWQQGDGATPEGAISGAAPHEPPRDCAQDCAETTTLRATPDVPDDRVGQRSSVIERR